MALTLNGTTGIVAPGTETFGDGTALGGATNPIVSMAKGAAGYVQSYIVNNTNGTSSSADLVAYPSNGSDSHGWVDVGITSLSYADTTYTVTGPNESYIFGSAPTGSGTTGNLVYATDNTGSANAHQWYVGGFTQAKGAWKMQLNSSGLQLANALPIASGGTNSTATPTSGGVGYGTGTAHAYTSAGTAGQALISTGTGAPTWGSAGAYVLLGSVTASAASTVSVNGYFSSSYDNYFIVVNNLSLSSGVQLKWQAMIGGTAQTDGTYSRCIPYTSSAVTGQTSAAIFDIGAAPSNGNVCMSIFRPLAVAYKGVKSEFFYMPDQNTPSLTISTGGYGGATTAWTGIQFLANSGTITGTFYIYGIAKA